MTFIEKNCPICDKKMEMENKIKYVDYACRCDDHGYMIRMVESLINNEIVLTKMRVRIGNQFDRNYIIKINFDEGYSDIWSSNGSDPGKDLPKRTKLDKTWIPDFTDIEKLKNKIKLYLTLS